MDANQTSLRLGILSLFALTSLYAGETEWPQFRGPGGQGNSAATDVPVKWSANENVAWKVELGGRGWSSPVLSKGRLYLTAAVGEPGADGMTLRALCLDPADGRMVWDTEVFRPDTGSTSAMHRKNSPASATPIVADGRLYVHFGHMGTAALDLGGKVIWRQTSLKYPPVHGNGGSPVLVDGLLAFSCDAAKDPFIVALDAATGDVRWKTPRRSSAKKSFSFSTPLAIRIGDTTQIISPASGYVGAYDAKSGQEIWRVDYGEGYSVVPRPSFAHGLVFVSSGFDNAAIIAIRPDGAKGDVTDSHVVWKEKKGAPKTPSMVVLGDELYCVSDNGIATCADARTGKIHWSERLGGDVSASPVAADGRVYFQNETGTGYVLKAGRTFQLLAKNDLGEPTLASYAVADGALYIRSEKHLWKIGRK